MRKNRRIVSIEVDRVLTVRRHAPPAPAWCAQCPARVGMVSPEEAAALIYTSTRTIYRWVEVGQLHFIETPEGRLLICPNSLPPRG